jgi:hypothetical protein
MKRLIQSFARLYPSKWRERYGSEFDALLEDTNPGARTAFNVLAGAFAMQLRIARKAVSITVLAAALVSGAAWFAGQHPYISPGNNLVLRQDSNLGAMVTMLVVLVVIVMFLASLVQLVCGKFRGAGKTALVGIAIMAAFMLLVTAISVMTPRTIVSIGDGYCYDLWCVGVQRVETIPQGQSVLYKTHVRLFSDANSVRTSAHGESVYLVDQQGRRFPLVASPAANPLDVTLGPGETVNAELTFVAAADARQLYLTKDSGILPPWVFLYLGSDLSPLHRRTLLRVL